MTCNDTDCVHHPSRDDDCPGRTGEDCENYLGMEELYRQARLANFGKEAESMIQRWNFHNAAGMPSNDGGWVVYPDHLEVVNELVEMLQEARRTIESLPQDVLGAGKFSSCAPDGECGEMEYPLRDELLDKINKVLAPFEKEAE